MGEFLHEFTYSFDGGDLGEDQELDVVVRLDESGSGEDYDCSASIVSLAFLGQPIDPEDLSKEFLQTIEEKAAENYMEAREHPSVPPGRYRWRKGLGSGVVEVLGCARVPGRSDWLLVVKDRANDFLATERIRLLNFGEIHDDEGELALEPCP